MNKKDQSSDLKTVAAVASNVPAEGRQNFRYRLDLSVRFGSPRAEPGLSDDGTVVNISSGGILVTSGEQPPVGELVEMRIEWPSLLDGRLPLRPIATARVLR
jgi:hypothetical protein